MKAMSKSSKRFMLTYIIIALNIAVYAYTSALGGDLIKTNSDVILQYGQVNSFVIYRGWYWQLFTAIFIHVNIIHLFGNMFFLLIFGFRAEEMFSIQEYLLIYFLSGLAGNLLTLLLGPDMISAGASGAIFGVFGACTIYIRRAIGQSIITALMYAFFLFMINISPGVNVLAHFGGLVVGLLFGYVLATKRKVRTAYKFSYNYSV